MMLVPLRSWIFPLTLAALVSTAQPAGAQQVFDTFSYPDGSLSGQNGGAGWFSSWNGGGTVVGGEVQLSSPVGVVASRTIAAPLWATNGASAYFSFDFRISNTATSATFNFTGGGSQSTLIGISNGELSLPGISANGVIQGGVNYRVVLRVTRNDAGDDQATLWLNPTDEASTPLLTNLLPYVNSGIVSYNGLNMSQLGSNSLFVDSVRMGTTFSSVIPEPSAFALIGGAGSIGLWWSRRRRSTRLG